MYIYISICSLIFCNTTVSICTQLEVLERDPVTQAMCSLRRGLRLWVRQWLGMPIWILMKHWEKMVEGGS